jgi:hypothetical protein
MKKWLTMFTTACLLASPAWAGVRDAAFATSADPTRAESSMFIGLNYGVAFDRKARARHVRASFKVARMVKTSDAQFRVGEGLALTAAKDGVPTFHVGGQDIGSKAGKANLNTGGTVAIAVVAVLAVGAVAAYYALRDPCDHRECE